MVGSLAETLAASIPVKLAPLIAGKAPVSELAAIPKASIEVLVGLVACAVTLADGNVTVLLDKSKLDANLDAVIPPLASLAAGNVPVVNALASSLAGTLSKPDDTTSPLAVL